MLKELLKELKKAAFSVLPIYILVILLALTGLAPLSGYEILTFSVSTLLAAAGIGLFSFGADRAMTPIGKKVGRGITKQGRIWVLLTVVFIFGFFITAAEPDLAVLAGQTASVIGRRALIFSISAGVAIFLLLAVMKIVKKTDLIRLLGVIYTAVFGILCLLVFRGEEKVAALCFDSGGVTTGPMTVPFLMALGAGVASVLSQKKEKDASFGFIAFSSAGPVLVMLLIMLFSKGSPEYELADYSTGTGFGARLLSALAEKFSDVGVAVAVIAVCFVVIDIIFIRSGWRRVVQLLLGLGFVLAGLVLFLAAIDCSYMAVGFGIGTALAGKPAPWAVILCFVFGALTVIAEPAISILISQVEEITNGTVRRRPMLAALVFGVGSAIAAAALRIYFSFSILYILIPGYTLCFILSFMIPRIYTAIAFDAGGVASGPLTSSFILPLVLGLCSEAAGPGSILSQGFGVVALVALSPILSIEILGFVSRRRAISRSRKNIKKILEGEDDKLIVFDAS